MDFPPSLESNWGSFAEVVPEIVDGELKRVTGYRDAMPPVPELLAPQASFVETKVSLLSGLPEADSINDGRVRFDEGYDGPY